MGDLAAAFRSHNIETTEAEIEAALRQALAEQSPIARDATGELSASELEALESVGVDVDATRPGNLARVRSAARYAELASSSLPTAEVAMLLGVSEGRVRQKLGENQLFSIRHPAGGRGHLFPLFQFHARRPLPGLAAVLRALPTDLHPLAVRSFFLHPSPDLATGGGEPQSPRDWLIGGGGPEAVAALARDL
jgi:hypothetical protein